MKKFKAIAGSEAFSGSQKIHEIFEIEIKGETCTILANVPFFEENKCVVKKISRAFHEIGRLYFTNVNFIFRDTTAKSIFASYVDLTAGWLTSVGSYMGYWCVKFMFDIKGKNPSLEIIKARLANIDVEPMRKIEIENVRVEHDPEQHMFVNCATVYVKVKGWPEVKLCCEFTKDGKLSYCGGDGSRILKIPLSKYGEKIFREFKETHL